MDGERDTKTSTGGMYRKSSGLCFRCYHVYRLRWEKMIDIRRRSSEVFEGRNSVR